jgi:Predicted metal-dependent hydrolase with the TIM-barrel fold
MLFINPRLIPYVEQIGVSDRDIRTMTIGNPRHFFGFTRHTEQP